MLLTTVKLLISTVVALLSSNTVLAVCVLASIKIAPVTRGTSLRQNICYEKRGPYICEKNRLEVIVTEVLPYGKGCSDQVHFISGFRQQRRVIVVC